ncbi:hypothetical protein RLK93_07635, partial [Streptococcus pneumoniae]|nr:hypothetical protein [Streptococcus pneumoniae]
AFPRGSTLIKRTCPFLSKPLTQANVWSTHFDSALGEAFQERSGTGHLQPVMTLSLEHAFLTSSRQRFDNW